MTEVTDDQDVFLSYNGGDRAVAQAVAEGLRQNGISVWWDNGDILPGVMWKDYLDDKLRSSRCVLVLWTSRSIGSASVLREAEEALKRRRLIPVLLEPISIPAPFNAVQYADLVNWHGDRDRRDFLRLIESVKRILQSLPPLGKETRRIKEEQRSIERRAQELFQRNLQSASVVDHVEVEGTRFYRHLSWSLNPHMNLLLGRNGYGKTYLLRTLVSLLQHDDDAAFSTLGTGSATVSLMQAGGERSIRFANELFDEEDAVGKLPVLAIPDARFLNRASTTLRPNADDNDSTIANLAHSGAQHFLGERPYDSMIQTFLYGLCLDFFEADRSFAGAQFDLIRGVVQQLTDTSFDFSEVRRESRDSFTLFVITEGNEDNPLPVQKASQGTLSVIATFGLIYDFLKSLGQEQTKNVAERNGIVLIDEVDAHLHPAWQQKILGLLRSRFPKVQFLVTAHSPMVVAGCLEDEVSVLRKTKGSGFSLHQFPNDFVGWPPEEIYRRAFEVEQPDETFVRYEAMRPFQKEIERRASELENRPARSEHEDDELREYEQQLHYIDKVEKRRSEHLDREDAERQTKMLKERLLGLESAHEAAARTQQALDKLTSETDRVRARARGATLFAIGLAIALLFCLAILGLLWRKS